jgi:hypothetical protein
MLSLCSTSISCFARPLPRLACVTSTRCLLCSAGPQSGIGEFVPVCGANITDQAVRLPRSRHERYHSPFHGDHYLLTRFSFDIDECPVPANAINPTANYVVLSRQVGEFSSTQSYERSTHFFQERNSRSLSLPLIVLCHCFCTDHCATKSSRLFQ